MPIGFDTIPALRTPGSYIEFNNELAGAISTEFMAVMIGQRLAAGTIAEGVPTRITDPNQAKVYLGQGSMGANMAAAWLAANPTTKLLFIALDDNAAGQPAAGSVTVNSAATGAGTLYLYLGGTAVAVAVASGDSADAIATSIAAAITAIADLPVTAAVDGTVSSKVNVTARHKGEAFNGYDLRANYYGEQLPAGVTLSFASLSGGTGNPDLTTALDAMGDDWFNWMVQPYTDTANLTALNTELTSRWGALRQIDCRAFNAYAGTLSAMGTFGDGLNSPHLSVLGTGKSPTPVYLAAAINGAVAAYNLAIDPARPLQTLKLPGMLAPSREDQLTRSERDTLLYDGISTYTVDRDGTCRIERQITTYQVNDGGLPDASYLDINTPETLSRIRYEQRSMIAQKYPRHKLADDGTNYGTGQPIVTPNILKGQFLVLYRQLEAKGWVEDYDTYAADLIVERDIADRNRINWRDTPNLVNQARVFAGKQQFIV